MIEKGDVQDYEVWCAILALIESTKTHAQAQHWGTARTGR
jgi:hypothetical protein